MKSFDDLTLRFLVPQLELFALRRMSLLEDRYEVLKLETLKGINGIFNIGETAKGLHDLKEVNDTDIFNIGETCGERDVTLSCRMTLPCNVPVTFFPVN